MPTSWYQAASCIVEKAMAEKPQSILDVGVGFGKYGVMLREMLEIPFKRYDPAQWICKIDGVEAVPGYRNPLHNYIYNKIYYQAIEEALPLLDRYDVILMIDILQYFNKSTGRTILEELLKRTKKALVLSIPIRPDILPESDESTEKNSFWKLIDFVDYKMEYSILPAENNKALVVKLYPNDMIRRDNEKNLDLDLRITEAYAKANEESANNSRREPLHIAYYMPHRNLTGGLKMLIDQVKWLKSRGHIIDVYMKSQNQEDSALPAWENAAVDRNSIIPVRDLACRHIQNCDVIMAGWIEQLPELIGSKIPVLYWEQGNGWLFGDVKGITNIPTLHKILDRNYSYPCIFASVSDFIARLFQNRYNRVTPVIPNGINTNLFFPGESPDRNRILLVGNPFLSFKGFDMALSALNQLWKAGYRFEVRWICQNMPALNSVPYPIEIIRNPPQDQLPGLYRTADLFIFSSIYEGFGMPPLEAMASGLPIICTRCGGVEMYVTEDNAMLIEPENSAALAEACACLLNDRALRRRLGENARKTALAFDRERVLLQLENLLYVIKDKMPEQRH